MEKTRLFRFPCNCTRTRAPIQTSPNGPRRHPRNRETARPRDLRAFRFLGSGPLSEARSRASVSTPTCRFEARNELGVGWRNGPGKGSPNNTCLNLEGQKETRRSPQTGWKPALKMVGFLLLFSQELPKNLGSPYPFAHIQEPKWRPWAEQSQP